MITARIPAIVVVVAATLTACARRDEVTPPPAALSMDEYAAAVVTDRLDRWRFDAYQFQGMRLEGDRLSVAVQYGGGCTAHDFAFLVAPVFMESEPVQMRATLSHDGRGDPCRALIGDTVRIDLTPVRDAWRRAYRATSGTVVLQVAGWPEPVRYSF